MNKEYVEFKCGKNLLWSEELIKDNEPPIRIGLTKEQFIEYQKLQQENKELKEELDKYKRLIEYIKGLDFYEFELDYDYEENPVSNYYPADMEYHINNWLKIEEIDKEKDENE